MSKNNTKRVNDPFKKTQLLIWDFDRVLFRPDQAFKEQAYIASAKVGVEMVPDMDFDAALKMVKANPNPYHAYKTLINKYNLDSFEATCIYNQVIDVSGVQPNKELVEKIRETQVSHCILSSNYYTFIEKTLPRIGLHEIFNENNIFSRERYSVRHRSIAKHTSEIPIKTAWHAMEKQMNRPLYARHLVYIEDTQRNLQYPYKMGAPTVLLDNNLDASKPKNYADFAYKTAEDFLDDFNAKRHQSPQP